MRTFAIGLPVILGLFTALAAASAFEVPFQFQDGFIRVQVSVEGSAQPLNFLVDTGAGVSVIDQRVMERLGIRRGRRVTVNGVQSVTTGYWPQHVAGQIGGVALPRRLLAVDLSALGRACVTPVDGLLGVDFFRGRAVQIDFSARKIRLLTPEAARQVPGETLALELRRCGMRVPVKINDRPAQWLRLDTGCAAPLHWVTASINPEHCSRQVAVGLTELALPATNVTATLGSETFRETGAVIHTRPIFAGEAGLLGNGLLARFSQITVDARSGRLILSR